MTPTRSAGLASRLLACGLLGALAVAAPATQPPAGKKYAVLVAAKEYDHSALKPLKYTENDVVELAAVLRQPRAQLSCAIGQQVA